MKERIIKLLKSDCEADNLLGYYLLKKKCKFLWVANLFYLRSADIIVHVNHDYLEIAWDSWYDYEGPYYKYNKSIKMNL